MKTLCRMGVVLAVLCLSVGGGAEDRGRGPDPALVAQIDALLQEPGLKSGVQGVVVQSLVDGTVWYARNADLRLLPASNQKLLVSAAALHLLGPTWQYQTLLLRTGAPDDNGVLHGNLTLKGSGDPLLSAKDLDDFVESVKVTGIKRVEGKVIGDESRFDRRRLGDGWEWDDLPAYYAAPISALNLNENTVEVTVEPGRRPGDPVRVSIAPPEPYMKVVVRAKTVPKGEKSALAVRRDLGGSQIVVEGVLALGAPAEDHKPVPITVDDPARFATFVFVERLRRAGIAVDGYETEGGTPTMGTLEIARHLSPPLSEIVARLNKRSDNLVAECLLKTLGAEKGKMGVGSWASGREAAMGWLIGLGLDAEGLEMADGSGLSRHNFVTARNLALLLQKMSGHPQKRVFLDSLPIAGVDGTLANRMKGTPAEKNCRAKTGTSSNVSSLSGYVATKDGEPLLFVMLMNNHPAQSEAPRSAQDKIAALLAGWERKKTTAR